MDAASRRLLFGTDEPLPDIHELRAGPLALRLAGTRLLSIRAGGHEVWHGVAFLHRNTHWGTPEPVVERLELAQGEHGFEARVRAHVPVHPRIELEIEIKGDAQGRVRYQGRATPQGDIETQRTGLCLMHPMAAAGRRVEVLHADGRRSQSTFPSLIAPWPPFMLVQGIRHEYADGAWASCRFDGDVFELEDQRNNADASFKTYSRSNLMPRPYRLRAGQAVMQAVELRLLDAPPAARSSAEVLSAPASPRIGIGIECADANKASPALLARLRELRPQHLQLHVPLEGTTDWRGIAALLGASGAALRLDVSCAQKEAAAPGLARLAADTARAGLRPDALTVFPSSPPLVEAARAAFPGCAIGGGTPHFFTQLNRIEDLGRVDFLRFTTSALVHGADDESVMAGLASLPSMARTLAARHPGLAVRVGPSAIGALASPLGAQPPSDGTRRLALARHDPRSRALFGAAWLLGYVAHGVVAGFDSLSIVTLTGTSGLLRDEAGTLRPCPAFFVLQALLAGGPEWTATTSESWVALASGKTRLVANLAPVETTVPSTHAGGKLLDAASWAAFESSGGTPWRPLAGPQRMLRLPAYAVSVGPA